MTECVRCCPAPQFNWPDIRAICFDAGDTLVLDRPSMGERVGMALAECAVDYDLGQLGSALRDMVAYGIGRYLQGASSDDPHVAIALTHLLLQRLGVEPIQQATVVAVAQAYAAIGYDRYLELDAIRLLETLQGRGFKIGIISDWEPDLPELLETLGCRHLLDSISVSSLVGATKPDARLYRHALTQLAVEPRQAVHIGDYLELDVAGARAVGMRAALYDWKRQYDGDHAGVPVVRSFDELSVSLLALPAPQSA